MELNKLVCDAGILGAGGAGFPTHVKINCKAEFVLANGAECEPLLRVDQQVMQYFAADVVRGIRAVKEFTGAKRAVICLKEHYHAAVAALQEVLKDADDVELHLLQGYYPAGDEQQIVYEVTGRVVPTGGLPLDVGAVVCNVSTLTNIAAALDGKKVTEKYVTVGGAVKNPVTLRVPVGISLQELMDAAGGPTCDCKYIIGGPCTGGRHAGHPGDEDDRRPAGHPEGSPPAGAEVSEAQSAAHHVGLLPVLHVHADVPAQRARPECAAA